MHSTFKVLWNTLPAVWNIKVKLTDISLVFGLYSVIHWRKSDTYVLSTVFRLYPKKVHQQLHKQSAQVKKLDLPRKRLIGKLPAPVVWLFEDRVSMICLTCLEDLPRYFFPLPYTYTYLFHSAMDWHKSLCKVKLVHQGVDGNHESRIPYLIN